MNSNKKFQRTVAEEKIKRDINPQKYRAPDHFDKRKMVNNFLRDLLK